MPRAAPALAALAATLAAGCAGGPRVPPPYPDAPVVRGVEIRGAHALDAGDLRARLGTEATGRWPWDAPRRFDPVVWEEDLRRLPRIYEAEGFYAARVTSHEVREVADGVVVAATVEEGSPTRVVEVVIRGLDALPEDVRRRALRAVALREGARFREADWEATQAGIRDALAREGYAAARLAAEARVDPAARRARALVEVTPGPRYRFGPVRLTTALPAGISPEAILAEARAAADPNAWYDPAALREAQGRVYAMGAFDAVEVTAGAPDPASGRVPIAVAVRAGPSRALRGGAGVGLSPSRDDVHVTGEWVERPFGGLGALRLRASAGYALVPPLATSLSATGRAPPRRAPVARLAADVDRPLVLAATGLHLFARAELELAAEEAYRVAAVRPGAGIAWSPLAPLELAAEYRFSAARLLDTPLGADPARPAAFGCAAPCTLSALELHVTWERHPVWAERGGNRARLRLRGAGGPLGGAYDVVQVLADAEGEQPLDALPGTSLAGRIAGGTVLAPGRRPVPVLERLSGGGPGMRGYGAGRLSPVMAARVGGTAAAVPVGGRGLLEGTLELRRRIAGSLSAVLFADAGAASVEPFDAGRLLSRLTYAAGAGLRLATPIGAVRLDVAYRLPLGPALPVVEAPGGSPALPPPAGCFGLGAPRSRAGGPDSPCTVHIWIGEGP